MYRSGKRSGQSTGAARCREMRCLPCVDVFQIFAAAFLLSLSGMPLLQAWLGSSLRAFAHDTSAFFTVSFHGLPCLSTTFAVCNPKPCFRLPLVCTSLRFCLSLAASRFHSLGRPFHVFASLVALISRYFKIMHGFLS